MIDREARDKLALAIRRLGSRQITLKQFREESNFISKDDAVICLTDHIDFLYSDNIYLSFQRNKKPKLPLDIRRNMARTVVFLHSDYELVEEGDVAADFYYSLIKFLSGVLVAINIATIITPTFISWIGLPLQPAVRKWMEKLKIKGDALEPCPEVLKPRHILPFTFKDEYCLALQYPRYMNGKISSAC